MVPLIVIIIIAVLIAVFDILSIFIFKFGRVNNTDREKDVSEQNVASKNFFGKRDNYIAVMHIEGVIEKSNDSYDQEYLLDTLDILVDDPANKGILLFLDTPGGAVFEADALYLALLGYKNSTGRPVWAYEASLCASGGYYINCAASKIWANRNTLTGSIGVIAGEYVDATELLKKIGIKSRTIHSGRNKNMFNFNEPVTPEQETIMQSVADECYEQFVDIVAQSRNLTPEYVRSIADGRIYTAQQALNNNLIDCIGSFEDALAAMKKECFCDNDYDTVDYRYEKEPSLVDRLFTKAMGNSTTLFDLKSALAQKKIRYPAYLYK